jgi:thiol reductant ABC exporter CydD subunit
MPSSAGSRLSGRLLDRRLAARVAVTRRYLVAAVVVGLAATVCVVVQAVLLATVVSDTLFHHATLSDVTPQLVGLAAAFGGRALCVWGGEAAAQRTSATVTSSLRRQLLRQTLDLGPSWLAGERTGELSLTATRGVAALDVYFGRYLPQAVLAALTPLALLVWVGWEDWVSLLVLVGVVALVPVAMVVFGRKAGQETHRQWRRLSSLSARFLDLVQGLPTLRAFGRQAHGRREVAESTEGLRRTSMRLLRVAFLSALAMEFLAGMGVGLVAMVLGLRLLGGTVSLFTALAVLLVSPEVFLPLRRAGAEFHASAEGQAAAERILDLLDTPLPVVVPSPTSGPGAAPDPAAAPVRLVGVTVAYAGRDRPVLDRFSLDLAPGEHVALLGPSGAGKSTVLGLLLGFVHPGDGVVMAGDVDLATVRAADWRRHLAWVPQRPHLFAGTLADNLRLADASATDADLHRALAATGLAETVGELPAGLETVVGEGGISLSAGERQRLALARAVLRDAPLVLLDEPIAHLDATTEAELRASLGPWFEGRTVLVAAHRPSLVGRFDRVVDLEPPSGDQDLDGAEPLLVPR